MAERFAKQSRGLILVEVKFWCRFGEDVAVVDCVLGGVKKEKLSSSGSILSEVWVEVKVVKSGEVEEEVVVKLGEMEGEFGVKLEGGGSERAAAAS